MSVEAGVLFQQTLQSNYSVSNPVLGFKKAADEYKILPSFMTLPSYWKTDMYAQWEMDKMLQGCE